MDGDQTRPPADERANAGFDGPRDVVQLCVEEDVGAEGFELRANRVAIAVEGLVADFKPNAERREPFD